MADSGHTSIDMKKISAIVSDGELNEEQELRDANEKMLANENALGGGSGIGYYFRRYVISFRTIFTFVLIAAVLGCGLAVWFSYDSPVQKKIEDMSKTIVQNTMSQMTGYIETFLGDRQNTVSGMVTLLKNGVMPQATNPDMFDLDLTNSLVWSVRSTTDDIWIMNIMIGQTIAAGYSLNSSSMTFAWFGKDGPNNMTRGFWERRADVSQVNQETGRVDYSNPPTWSSAPLADGTIWPSAYKKNFPNGETVIDPASVPLPHYYYMGRLGVDKYYPQYGIQYSFVYPFPAPDGKGGYRGSLGSCTFNTKTLLDLISRLDLRGGIMYITDEKGGMVASSTGEAPVYGPFSKSELVPFINEDGKNWYGQFNYSDYPNDMVHETTSRLISAYGSYSLLPREIDSTTLDIAGEEYQVASTLIESYGLKLRTTIAIPKSSFIGFTRDARRNAGLIAGAILLAVVIVAVFTVEFAFARPLSRIVEDVMASVSEDTSDPRSIFYSHPVEQENVRDKSDYATSKGSSSHRGSSKSSGSSRPSDEDSNGANSGMDIKVTGVDAKGHKSLGGLALFEMQNILKAHTYQTATLREASRHLSTGLVCTAEKRKALQYSGVLAKTVTLCVIKLHSFDHITVTQKQSRVTAVITNYTTEMSRIVTDRGGCILKHDYQCMVVMLNAPVPVIDHEYIAILIAYECTQKMKELNATWQRDYRFPPINQSIGIHTGNPMVGSLVQASYTCFGKDADIANQMADEAKRFGVPIVCSGSVRTRVLDSLKNSAARNAVAIRTLGKDGLTGTIVYHVASISVQPTHAEEYQMCQDYEEAYRTFTEGHVHKDRSMIERAAAILDQIKNKYESIQGDIAWAQMRIECEKYHPTYSN